MAKAAKKTTAKKAGAEAKGKAPAKAAAKKTASKKTAEAKPAPKAAAKKPTAKKSASKKGGGTANAAFMAPLTPSDTLAAVVGAKPLPRTEIVKKVWDHIKAENLQDPNNKRMINADEKLKPIFGKDQISMFELAKVINGHVK